MFKDCYHEMQNGDTVDTMTERAVQQRKKRMVKWFVLRKIVLPAIFKICSRKSIDEKMVVFADDRHTEMPDNMESIYDGLQALGYKVLQLFSPKVSNNSILKQLINFWYYCRFTRYYARAKFVVVDDYFAPLYANTARPETKVVQLWHACGAFKKWGYSTQEETWGMDAEMMGKYPIHTNYTHVIVSSKEVVPHYAEAFNMDADKIFVYGVPRTDVFFDEAYMQNARKHLFDTIFKKKARALQEKEKQLSELSASDEQRESLAQEKEAFASLDRAGFMRKKVILYAPTFRGNSIRGSYNPDEINNALFKDALKDDYILVYKLHPLVAKKPELPDAHGNFAVDLSEDIHINEALAAADILISDYSSLIFEYALLVRPMIFYAFDYEDYIDERGFYYDYNAFVPGPIVKDNDALLDAIQNIQAWFDPEKVRRFKEKFMHACDGNATKRVIDRIFTETDRQ